MSNFWKFKPSDKYDRITEGRHDHLYYGALSDCETGIDKIDRNTFILFGREEALYMKPKGIIYRLGLELLGAFLSLKNE